MCTNRFAGTIDVSIIEPSNTLCCVTLEPFSTLFFVLQQEVVHGHVFLGYESYLFKVMSSRGLRRLVHLLRIKNVSMVR